VASHTKSLTHLRARQKNNSLKASKAQAKQAAQRLIAMSKEYKHVVLIGHGGMNWLMAKALLKEGWVLEGKGSYENWGVSVFRKQQAQV